MPQLRSRPARLTVARRLSRLCHRAVMQGEYSDTTRRAPTSLDRNPAWHIQEKIMYRRIVRMAVAWSLLGVVLFPLEAQAQTGPTLPAGFRATVAASGLATPTAMAIGPDGRLYVAQENGVIRAVGRAGIATVASGFTIPLGLAWHKHKLYVSWTGAVSTLTPSRTYATFTRRTIVSGLPTGKHQNDSMAFRGGWMYLGVGSTCNACAEADRRSATIM